MNFVDKYLSQLEKDILFEEMEEAKAKVEFELARIAHAKEMAPIFTIKYNETLDCIASHIENLWGFRFKEDMPYVSYSYEDVLQNYGSPECCLSSPFLPFKDVYPHTAGYQSENPITLACECTNISEYQWDRLFKTLDWLFSNYPSLFTAIVISFPEKNMKLVEQEYGLTLSEEILPVKDTLKGAKRRKALIKEKKKLHQRHERTGSYGNPSYTNKGWDKEYMNGCYKRGNRKTRNTFDLPSGKSGYKKLGSRAYF